MTRSASFSSSLPQETGSATEAAAAGGAGTNDLADGLADLAGDLAGELATDLAADLSTALAAADHLLPPDAATIAAVELTATVTVAAAEEETDVSDEEGGAPTSAPGSPGSPGSGDAGPVKRGRGRPPGAASAAGGAGGGAPSSNLDTPVMRQYLEVKERYADCIVFFRLGDFYEMFFDDAIVVSQLLDLTLTSRDKHREVPVPMCGVPHHAARHYVAKLIGFGRKVAICDQVEDARKAKKIVRRAVTQVITPGVLFDEDQLEPKAGHYLAALLPGRGLHPAGLAFLDVSTGEFAAMQGSDAEALEEIGRIDPAELLVVEEPADKGAAAPVLGPVGLPLGLETPPPDPAQPMLDHITRRLRIPLGTSRASTPAEDQALLAGLLAEPASAPGAVSAAPATGSRRGAARAGAGAGPGADAGAPGQYALAAAAACVRYARATQPAGGLPLFRLRLFRPTDSLVIDESTKANLELIETLMERKRQGSLLSVLDQTKTAMGGRLLRRWLLLPLMSLQAIGQRHDAVEWLVERQAVRRDARERLGDIHDLERLTGRLSASVATPRDLDCLQRSLAELPRLHDALVTAAAASPETQLGLGLPALLDLGGDLCGDVQARIAAAICENPPINWREGGFIRRGFSAELDELVELSQGGKDHILRIEERERQRSGISSLKVRYNRVFGYYIEITRSNLHLVPTDFVRKQTLANAERFVTSELAEYEAKVLGAEERRIELELALFESLRKELLGTAARLLDLAQRVAQLDALAGLAELAHRQGYVRPQMTADLRMCIEDGRHPVVEQLAERGRFVPNDTQLDPDGEQVLILTGPNMAGKSTVMRQVALLSILAQMGSFVPARRAELGLVDRVCTRVGASDNLARGESTFMVEMRETSQILQRATRRSLVILDEIGRGTSTYDGVSIAWAVAEYLHDVIGCKTLFATHYHELCALAAARPRVRNFSVAVRQYQGEVVFLHKLVPGGASRSYGIEVARLAGLPKQVVTRAREILAALELPPAGGAGGENAALPVHGMPRTSQLPLFVASVQRGEDAGSPPTAPAAQTAAPRPPAPSPAESGVLTRLRGLECDDLTPREALALLAELTTQLKPRPQAV